jgi:hypothetical protein
MRRHPRIYSAVIHLDVANPSRSVAFPTPRPDSTGEPTLFEAAHLNFDVGVRQLVALPGGIFPDGICMLVLLGSFDGFPTYLDAGILLQVRRFISCASFDPPRWQEEKNKDRNQVL